MKEYISQYHSIGHNYVIHPIIIIPFIPSYYYKIFNNPSFNPYEGDAV
jgi:hypothetical protein